MTFYQELQLSSAGSKQLIKNTHDKKEKFRHILIYNFKVYLVMIFCVAIVTIFSMLTGNSNSVVGVCVLLSVLVLRQADFGIQTKHGLISIAGIFVILAAGPRLANIVPAIPAFFINFLCIMLLMIFSCHNVIMYNHSTFVLSYLLLLGYDVSGHDYLMRIAGLSAGMLICMIVFYKNQKNRHYHRTFKNLFSEFNITSSRMYPYIGIIGGICVGYSAGYAWQTAFNTFGALSIAAGLFGAQYAVILRISANILSSAYTFICDKILSRMLARF